MPITTGTSILQSHVAPVSVWTDRCRSGGGPRGLARSEIREDVADPMEFACLVEEEVRAERHASIAILRKRVIREYDHFRVRRPAALPQLPQHAEARALPQLQVEHDRVPSAAIEE